MWKYLCESGALDKGEGAINEAKREWRRMYDRRYKAERRKRKHEHIVTLGPKDNERIAKAAKAHNATVAEFLRATCIAYLDKCYVSYGNATLRNIEALMVRSLSALEEIGRKDGKRRWFAAEGIEDAKRTTQALRAEVTRELSKAEPLLEAIRNNPQAWMDILNLISDDSKKHRGQG